MLASGEPFDITILLTDTTGFVPVDGLDDIWSVEPSSNTQGSLPGGSLTPGGLDHRADV